MVKKILSFIKLANCSLQGILYAILLDNGNIITYLKNMTLTLAVLMISAQNLVQYFLKLRKLKHKIIITFPIIQMRSWLYSIKIDLIEFCQSIRL